MKQRQEYNDTDAFLRNGANGAVQMNHILIPTLIKTYRYIAPAIPCTTAIVQNINL
jgi:hypothetical protein